MSQEVKDIELTEMVVIGIDKDGKFYCTLRGVTAYNALRHVTAATWYLCRQVFGGNVPEMTPLAPAVPAPDAVEPPKES